MKYYFLSRKNGQVVSSSKERIDFDPNIFDLTIKEMTEKEMEELEDSDQIQIKNKKIISIQDTKIKRNEVQAFIDKIKTKTITEDERDEILIHLLQKEQIR